MTSFTPHDSIQLAQAVAKGVQAPIGHVDTVAGKVQVTHINGVIETLSNGDPVYQGDSLSSGNGAAVGMIFMDETVLSMSEDSFIVLDEMVYDSEAESGSMAFTMARGAFTFVSGQIAKTDPEGMTFKTPSALIGIRGSAGGININDLGHTLATLFVEIGNAIGEMVFSTAVGVSVVNQPLLALRAVAFNAPPSSPFAITFHELGSNFGTAIRALPNAEEHISAGFRQVVDTFTVQFDAGEGTGEKNAPKETIELEGPDVPDAPDTPNGPGGRGGPGGPLHPEALNFLGSANEDVLLVNLPSLGVLPGLGIAHRANILPALKHFVQYISTVLVTMINPETFGATDGGDTFHGNTANTRYVFDQGGVAVNTVGSDFNDQNLTTRTNIDTLTDAGGNDTIAFLNLENVTITLKESTTDTAFITSKVYAGAAASSADVGNLPFYNTIDASKAIENVFVTTKLGDTAYLKDSFSTFPANHTGYIIVGGTANDTIQMIEEAAPVGSIIFGLGGADILWGTAAGDKIFGGTGADSIISKGGDDTIYGGTGNDILDGDVGNDTIFGGKGDDTIIGGPGSDIMKGGAGANTFKYTAATFGTGDMDLVNDATNAAAGDSLFFSDNGMRTLLQVNGGDLGALTNGDAIGNILDATNNIALVGVGVGGDVQIHIDTNADQIVDKIIDVADTVTDATFNTATNAIDFA